MRSDVKSELQMLRELIWLLFTRSPAINLNCCFCGEELLTANPEMKFGHRRHPKVDVDITVHHQDEDRENNRPGNLRLCHTSCHKRYHNQKRAVYRKEVIRQYEEQKEVQKESQTVKVLNTGDQT